MARAGEDAVRAAVRERLAEHRVDGGGYRLQNLFRVLVARAPVTRRATSPWMERTRRSLGRRSERRAARGGGRRGGDSAAVAAVRVVIAGGHGQIALRLTALLAGRGDVVTGVVRNPEHRADVEAAGGTALVFDLEAGPRRTSRSIWWVPTPWSSPRVRADERGTAQGHRRPGRPQGCSPTPRSSPGCGATCWCRRSRWTRSRTPSRGEVWVAYVQAKRAAEEALRATDLDWTILRPGG